MFQKANVFFLICETPLHAGSGADLGIVDLPIQRERHTGYPKIEGSGLKGSIREAFESALIKEKSATADEKNIYRPSESVIERYGEEWKNLWGEWKGNRLKYNQAINLSFGPEDGNLHAGALGFTDARILLFPVKSMKGVFAWVTCPKVLEQFRQDLILAGISIPELPGEKTRTSASSLVIKDDKIVLEEYTIEAENDDKCTKMAEWLGDSIFPVPKEDQDTRSYWRGKMKKDVLVLSNDEFRDFVEMSTEVIMRTKIDNETGTVQGGALFSEEYLPTETVLYSLVLTTPVFAEEKGVFAAQGIQKEEDRVMEFFQLGLPEVIQVGANATIGKGLTRTVFMKG